MSNIDKQWLQQKIAEMEASRDEIPFGLDEDDSNTLAALRIALSSLEAEAVAEVCEGFTLRYIGYGPAPKSGVHIGDKLYTAPPSPVSVPDAISTRQAIAKMENHEPCDSINVAYKFGWNACRAAMLQGADGNSPVIPDCSTSAAQFVKDYCKSAGWSEKEFYETQVPMPDITSPSGWAAVSNSPLAIKSHVDLYMRSAPHHEVRK